MDLKLSNGVRKIAPEENCPPVRVRVWFRISVSNLPRTLSNECFT